MVIVHRLVLIKTNLALLEDLSALLEDIFFMKHKDALKSDAQLWINTLKEMF